MALGYESACQSPTGLGGHARLQSNEPSCGFRGALVCRASLTTKATLANRNARIQSALRLNSSASFSSTGRR